MIYNHSMVPLLGLDVDVRGEIDAAAMLHHLDLNKRLAVLVKAMGAVIYRSILNFSVHMFLFFWICSNNITDHISNKVGVVGFGAYKRLDFSSLLLSLNNFIKC